ncbi:hypothetical protein AB1Y20_009567 [Prymnesium parvum]|uniref:Uncharacterized protein n=1 Tax=Prymnesium parvum TaxID=97485 RepID=A0AB34K4L5_PRYPA
MILPVLTCAKCCHCVQTEVLSMLFMHWLRVHAEHPVHLCLSCLSRHSSPLLFRLLLQLLIARLLFMFIMYSIFPPHPHLALQGVEVLRLPFSFTAQVDLACDLNVRVIMSCLHSALRVPKLLMQPTYLCLLQADCFRE